MRKKLLLYFIILIITGMSVTGIFTTQHARNLYMGEVRDRIMTIAELYDLELVQISKSGGNVDYDTLAKDYANQLSSNSPTTSKYDGKSDPYAFRPRITIINTKGKVVGESETDYSRMENHLGRKEVQQALKGMVGEDIRSSKTLNVNFLYIAIPSSLPDLVIRVSIPLSQLRKIDFQILLYSIAGMVAGLILTTLLAFRFALGISKPLSELTSAAREISGGNYSKRVAVRSRDEIGQLASTFNDMAAKLEGTVTDLTDKNMEFDAILNSITYSFIAVDQKLRIVLINSIAVKLFDIRQENIIGKRFLEVIRNHQLNEILYNTIDSNVPQAQELTLGSLENGIFSVHASPITAGGSEGTNAGCIITIQDITAMKKSEQIRTEFVSNVTHELKTPLTSIRGFVETLRGGAIYDASVAPRFLEIIDIEAERLTMLINDILQLSEIENAKSDTNIELNDLGEIICEVVSILTPEAEKKSVTVKSEAVGKIIVNVNRNRIKQMLINLIENAIKYNRENGSVHVKAERLEGSLVMTVEDTGIGIEEQHLSRIFERFYRVDKGRSRSMGGTGLGLSIVKHIVNLYDGSISVKSEPGKGTKFLVRLPL
ncbi:MAG TPA: ATP-binding protein [Clostridia bacterium]|nr:ATP-binding protein [Clostridia bacterium]